MYIHLQTPRHIRLLLLEQDGFVKFKLCDIQVLPFHIALYVCAGCDGFILSYGLFIKLYRLLKYNTQFGTNTDNMWQFKGALSICTDIGMHKYC